MTVVRIPGGEPLHELRTPGPVAVVRVAYSPDGKFIVGQTGFRERDPVYVSHGLRDSRDIVIFRDQTDRVCVWDAVDGKLLAALRGRAFADGFGPNGELAIARAIGAEGELAIDLWRPAEVVSVLNQEGLSNWVHFSEIDTKKNRLLGWLLGLFFGQRSCFPSTGRGSTIKRIQNKRMTVRTAYVGIALTLLLIVG